MEKPPLFIRSVCRVHVSRDGVRMRKFFVPSCASSSGRRRQSYTYTLVDVLIESTWRKIRPCNVRSTRQLQASKYVIQVLTK